MIRLNFRCPRCQNYMTISPVDWKSEFETIKHIIAVKCTHCKVQYPLAEWNRERVEEPEVL